MNCDRCGKEIPSAQPTQVAVRYADQEAPKSPQHDLCELCTEKLVCFLGGRPLTEMAEIPDDPPNTAPGESR